MKVLSLDPWIVVPILEYILLFKIFYSSVIKEIFPTTGPPPRAWSIRIKSRENQQVIQFTCLFSIYL